MTPCTEDEAKQRWCPFVRAVGHSEVAVNRSDMSANPGYAPCIASACMAWRKTGSKCRDRRGTLVDRDMDGTGAWIEVGFCGLAGKPE